MTNLDTLPDDIVDKIYFETHKTFMTEIMNIIKWNNCWKPNSKMDGKAKRLQILMRVSEFSNGKAPIVQLFHQILNLHNYSNQKWIRTY